MAKMTSTRRSRRYKDVTVPYTIKDIKIFAGRTQTRVVRRQDPQPAAAQHSLLCRYCKKAMFVARGQITRFHKICRRLSRHDKTRTQGALQEVQPEVQVPPVYGGDLGKESEGEKTGIHLAEETNQ